jgi:Cu/Ag efflux pump CusA
MQPHPNKAEISALELQLKDYEKHLDESIKKNEIFAKTKLILSDIKRISKKLIELKRLNGL